MSKTLILFTMFLQIILQVSCANEAPKNLDRLITKKVERTNNFPFLFPRANTADCQDDSSPVDSGGIFSLTQYQVTNDNTIFQNLVGSPTIQNSIIKNTYIGSLWQRECGTINKNSNSPLCQKEGQQTETNFLLTKKGQPLQICDRVADFPRESPESVAVTTAHYLEESHQTFKRNFPQLTLQKVELEIFPIFESIFDFFSEKENRLSTIGFYDSDNLAYLPNQKKIAVYPPKQRESTYLWDSRFPAGHEMAHHIDYATSKKYRDCTIGIQDIGSESSYLSRKVCGAEAEALADLLAFATWSNLQDHLFGLTCLDALRDIKNNLFKNTEEKQLNQQVLAYFYEQASFTLKQNTKDSDVFGKRVMACERPDYTEIHTIGAIQGHHIYKLTSLAIAALEIEREQDRSDFLYKIVVGIMRKLNAEYKTIPLQGLGRIYYAFQDVLNQKLKESSLHRESKRALKREICETSRRQIESVGFHVYQGWCN